MAPLPPAFGQPEGEADLRLRRARPPAEAPRAYLGLAAGTRPGPARQWARATLLCEPPSITGTASPQGSPLDRATGVRARASSPHALWTARCGLTCLCVGAGLPCTLTPAASGWGRWGSTAGGGTLRLQKRPAGLGCPRGPATGPGGGGGAERRGRGRAVGAGPGVRPRVSSSRPEARSIRRMGWRFRGRPDSLAGLPVAASGPRDRRPGRATCVHTPLGRGTPAARRALRLGPALSGGWWAGLRPWRSIPFRVPAPPRPVYKTSPGVRTRTSGRRRRARLLEAAGVRRRGPARACVGASEVAAGRAGRRGDDGALADYHLPTGRREQDVRAGAGQDLRRGLEEEAAAAAPRGAAGAAAPGAGAAGGPAPPSPPLALGGRGVADYRRPHDGETLLPGQSAGKGDERPPGGRREVRPRVPRAGRTLSPAPAASGFLRSPIPARRGLLTCPPLAFVRWQRRDRFYTLSRGSVCLPQPSFRDQIQLPPPAPRDFPWQVSSDIISHLPDPSPLHEAPLCKGGRKTVLIYCFQDAFPFGKELLKSRLHPSVHLPSPHFCFSFLFLFIYFLKDLPSIFLPCSIPSRLCFLSGWLREMLRDDRFDQQQSLCCKNYSSQQSS